MMPNKQNITVLGSTGSIGVNTLDVVARHPERFRVVALTANRQVDKLFEQCRQFEPDYAVHAGCGLRRKHCSGKMQAGWFGDVEVLAAGSRRWNRLPSLPEVDSVMAAIVGAAGLRPSLAAARAGKRILLANKETLVMSGSVFMDAVRRIAAELLPIDSEHNAIFQSLPRDFAARFGGRSA